MLRNLVCAKRLWVLGTPCRKTDLDVDFAEPGAPAAQVDRLDLDALADRDVEPLALGVRGEEDTLRNGRIAPVREPDEGWSAEDGSRGREMRRARGNHLLDADVVRPFDADTLDALEVSRVRYEAVVKGRRLGALLDPEAGVGAQGRSPVSEGRAQGVTSSRRWLRWKEGEAGDVHASDADPLWPMCALLVAVRARRRRTPSTLRLRRPRVVASRWRLGLLLLLLRARRRRRRRDARVGACSASARGGRSLSDGVPIGVGLGRAGC